MDVPTDMSAQEPARVRAALAISLLEAQALHDRIAAAGDTLIWVVRMFRAHHSHTHGTWFEARPYSPAARRELMFVLHAHALEALRMYLPDGLERAPDDLYEGEFAGPVVECWR